MEGSWGRGGGGGQISIVVESDRQTVNRPARTHIDIIIMTSR